jgi:ATP synthase protein I
MSSDDKPDSTEPPSPELQKARKYSTQTALAMELPFTLVGAVLLGGLLGYFLDRWFHTKPILMFVFGLLGFAAGVREVIRRLS